MAKYKGMRHQYVCRSLLDKIENIDDNKRIYLITAIKERDGAYRHTRDKLISHSQFISRGKLPGVIMGYN